MGTATVTAETSAIIKNKRAIATGGKPTTKSTKPTTKATTTTTINSDKHYIDMTNSAKVSATSAKNASPTELKSSSAIGGAGSCGGGGGGGVEADSNGTLSNATATTTSSTTSIPNRNMQIPGKFTNSIKLLLNALYIYIYIRLYECCSFTYLFHSSLHLC